MESHARYTEPSGFWSWNSWTARRWPIGVSRGPIPLDEALPIAKQIAGALEAAHEKGIIHRDLKPANIKITPGGAVKVLDFGLAKVAQTAGADLSDSPTKLTGSAHGMIMGTAAYMPPEQAKGKEVDRAADVWAFGCVLYKMLAGQAVFQGETLGEILADVFKAEPDWSRLPAETPEGIRRLLRRCLQRDVRRRLCDIGDARIEIEESQSANARPPVAQAAAPRTRLPWIATAAAILIAAAAILWALRPVAPAVETRVEIATAPTMYPSSLAISPDGRKIVFEVTSEGRSGLWLRSLGSVDPRSLAGTDGASDPFWSPDSQSVGFLADSRLMRIDIVSGLVQTLANPATGDGGAWNSDDTILFSRGAIFRISAKGGDAVQVTQVKERSFHRAPEFLPDGRHFLYYATGNPSSPDIRGVYVTDIDGSQPRFLLDADTAAVYAPSGHLLFIRQGTLFAQGFDPVRLELKENRFIVSEEVSVYGAKPAVSAAVGAVAYRAGSLSVQAVWFDRSGKEIKRVGEPFGGSFGWSLSPGGRNLAVSRSVDRKTNIWLLDMARGVFNKFTSGRDLDAYPIWSPDGRRIVFQVNGPDLYQKLYTGAGTEEVFLRDGRTPVDWSPDGRHLLFIGSPKMGQQNNGRLFALPLDGTGRPDGDPIPVGHTELVQGTAQQAAQFSPNGKWIAFPSHKSGRVEIYVQPFPGPGLDVPVSTNGGTQVRWRRDGKELFYLAPDGRLMAVLLRMTAQGVQPSSPVPLFATRLRSDVFTTQDYSVSPNGQQFLTKVAQPLTLPITLILNWKGKP